MKFIVRLYYITQPIQFKYFQNTVETSSNPSNITKEEYFNSPESLTQSGRDIGRPKEINTKVQKFKVILLASF